MFLSKLEINVNSREFRRHYPDVHEMHRTVMSGYPDHTDPATPARQAYGVLWRIDPTAIGYSIYVQSNAEPDWSKLPAGYLAAPPRVRDAGPILHAATSGKRLAFRLVANPTRTIQPDREPGERGHGKRVPLRDPDKQVDWIVRQGQRHGFAVVTSANGSPDASCSPLSALKGRTRGSGNHALTLEPVRFDGHLAVTDQAAFTAAIRNGIGPGKAYGCGLLSLAPERTH